MKRLLVVVTVAEEIPVETIAGQARHCPRPVTAVKQRTRAVVNHHPAITREQAWFELSRTFYSIQGAQCTAQIAGIRHARFPGDGISIEGKRNAQVFSTETPAWEITQC